jgi:hypothetical protein
VIRQTVLPQWLPKRIKAKVARVRNGLQIPAGGGQATQAFGADTSHRGWPGATMENTHMQLAAVFRRVPEDYMAFVEERLGANTQGGTLAEARVNLEETVS